MPLKKKGSKSSKSSYKDEDPSNDPETMISADSKAGEKKKTKKKKKVKLTKAEKDKAKLDKAADTLKRSGKPFQAFVDRMDRWLHKNADRIIAFFEKFDVESEGILSIEEFKSGLYDLDVPCSSAELHLLCQLLDKEDLEEIEYHELSKGISYIRERETTYGDEELRPALVTTVSVKDQPHCAGCKLVIWDGLPHQQQMLRYIEILFRLVTFDGLKTHPGHFNKVVHSHITVFALMKIVREETSLQTSALAVFTDKTRSADAMLSPDHTLEMCGFKGGPQEEPEMLLLYYDYVIEHAECPLLMCDHYFGQNVKV